MSAKLLAATAVQNLQQAQGKVPAPAAAGPAAAIDNAITALLAYIPTEATALYLATVSALPAIQQAVPALKSWYVYWAFALVVTPLLFVLLFLNQLARNDQRVPALGELPWFRLLASMIAFASWALCIPNNPFVPGDQPGWGVLFGLIAVAVSIVLPLIETIYEWVRRQRKPHE